MIQKWGNVHLTRWLSRCTDADVPKSQSPNLQSCLLAASDLSLSFWQAEASNVISSHCRHQNHKNFWVIHQMAPFPVSCTQLMPQHGVLTWIPVWIIVFMFKYPQHSSPCAFLPPQKWLYVSCQKLWMSFTKHLWIFQYQRNYICKNMGEISHLNIWACKTDTLPTPQGEGMDPLAVAYGFIFVKWILLKLENQSIGSLCHLLSSWMENENINRVVSPGKEKMKRLILLALHLMSRRKLK